MDCLLAAARILVSFFVYLYSSIDSSVSLRVFLYVRDTILYMYQHIVDSTVTIKRCQICTFQRLVSVGEGSLSKPVRLVFTPVGTAMIRNKIQLSAVERPCSHVQLHSLPTLGQHYSDEANQNRCPAVTLHSALPIDSEYIIVLYCQRK